MSDIRCANIFFQSVIGLFILLKVFLTEQKVSLILIWSNLSIFSFIGYDFGVVCKNYFQTQCHKYFLLCFHLSCIVFLFTLSFIDLHFMLVYIYVLGFFLIYDARCRWKIFLNKDASYSNHHLLQTLAFLHCITFAPLSKIS